MGKIITALDIARRDGKQNVRDWVKFMSLNLAQRGKLASPWLGKISGKPVAARIDFGRWIADCPYCGGAEYIDPDDPFIFCLSCNMVDNKGAALPVIIPPDRDIIESLVLARPVHNKNLGNAIQNALLAKPVIGGLSRSWNAQESVEDLRNQNKAITLKGG